MVKIERYDLEELLDQPLKLTDGKGITPGANIFVWKRVMSKKVTKGLALKKQRYAIEYVVALLNQYKKNEYSFNKNHLQTVKKCEDLGINTDHIRKCKVGSITRFCFTPEGMQSVFKQFYERGRLKEYKEENLEQELSAFVYLCYHVLTRTT